MKVIKRGIVPILTYYGDCYKCGSKMEANEEELRYSVDGVRSAHFAKCPVCAEANIITNVLFTEKIKEMS